MSWLIFTLLAINLWAISNIIDKNIVSKRVKNAATPLIIGGFGSLFYALLMFLVFNAAISLEGIALGLVYTCTLLLYLKAMQLEEASRVIAFFSLIPIFVAILAYFLLGESFGPEKYVGIILVTIGAAMISVRKGIGKKLTISKALYLMLLFVMLYAVYTIALKYSTGYTGFISIFAGMQFGLFLGGIALLFVYKIELKKINMKTTALVLTSQFTGVTGLLSFIYAVSIGPISLVSAIENTQPVFLLLFTTLLTIFKPHIIKEDISKGPLFLKALAIIIMVIGAYLVSI